MYELIITEKPSQAKKVAEALADTKPDQYKVKKVSYYKLTHKKKEIVVACAVGHLFTVAEKDKKGWVYPTFNIEWKATHEVGRGSDYTKEYLTTIKKLAKDADEFTIACDYDVEGEVIGERILKFLTKAKNGSRMKFSTTTKEDLVKAYENKSPSLDQGLAEAGITRHELDFLHGINLSRALTLSIKAAANRFKIMSTGRVQGPALKVLYEKEMEIGRFKSKKYWELYLHAEEEITAIHKEDKFWKKEEADKIKKKCKDKEATVQEIKHTKTTIKPPVPFDLTTLQTEAYHTLGIKPKRTLEIAQELYTNSYISYPRTSSQKLPPSIGYKKILNQLAAEYSHECAYIIKKTPLKPTEGKKTDAAHPAIYPTGVLPKKIEGQVASLYELIVRRFFATFGKPAIKESANIKINLNDEIFITKGSRTLERGWQELYGRFYKTKDEEIPKIDKGDKLKVEKVEQLEKETQPPKRYSEASIVRELEKRNLGTKATRANIIENLYDRRYITGQSIEVTGLGKITTETLQKYAAEILDEKLTRDFEEQMEQIQSHKKKPKEVIKENEKVLEKILTDFKKHEEKIGKILAEANYETEQKENKVGTCHVCKKGTLRLRRGRFGPFIACDRYEEGCKTTLSVPRNALVKTTDKLCKECGFPVLMVIKKGKRPQDLCINTECKTKEAGLSADGKKCPNCESELIVKRGMYGEFLACPGYPKCKYIEGGFNKKTKKKKSKKKATKKKTVKKKVVKKKVVKKTTKKATKKKVVKRKAYAK
jgi:DNA topoisomerase I